MYYVLYSVVPIHPPTGHATITNSSATLFTRLISFLSHTLLPRDVRVFLLLLCSFPSLVHSTSILAHFSPAPLSSACLSFPSPVRLMDGNPFQFTSDIAAHSRRRSSSSVIPFPAGSPSPLLCHCSLSTRPLHTHITHTHRAHTQHTAHQVFSRRPSSCHRHLNEEIPSARGDVGFVILSAPAVNSA